MKIIRKTEDQALFDLEQLGNGVLTFTYPASAGASVSCAYGPYPDFINFRCKCDMSIFEGKAICRSKKLVTARYLLVTAHGVPLESVDLSFQDKMLPLEKYGDFSCDSKLFEKMFSVCEHTLRCCVFPHTQGNSTFDLQGEKNREFALNWHGKYSDYVIVDGARRDREVWVGDLYPEIRNVWALFRNKEVIRNTFDVILDQIREDGFIPASSISMQVFYEYNCWFLIVLEDYLKVSGDTDFYLEHLEKVRAILRFILTILEDGCLDLGKMQTWAWTSSRHGKITSSNCVLYAALKAAARMEKNLGKDLASAQNCEALAARLKNKINEESFDRKKKLYYDIMGTPGRFSSDAAALAVLFGVCEQQDRKKVLSALCEKFKTPYGMLLYYPKEEPDGQNFVHNDHVWPFVNTLVLEALLENGQTEQALPLLQSVWGTMLQNGADTFWEIIDGNFGTFMRTRLNDPPDDRDTWNSECHGWSAGLPYLFFTYFAGVRPVEYGYQSIEFSPVCAGLNDVRAVVPAANGEIRVSIYKDADGVRRAELVCPESTQVGWKRNVAHLDTAPARENGYTVYSFLLKEQV